MNHSKAVGRATRFTSLVRRALPVVLTVMTVFAADHAMARKAKGGLHAAAGAKAPASQAAPGAPEAIKPIAHPRRHGAKNRPLRR